VPLSPHIDMGSEGSDEAAKLEDGIVVVVVAMEAV